MSHCDETPVPDATTRCTTHHPPTDPVPAAVQPAPHRESALPNRNQDPSQDRNRSNERGPSLLFGLVVMAVALFFLGFAVTIRRSGLAGDTDPGPRAIPMLVASALLIGGGVEAVRGWRWTRTRTWPARIAFPEGTRIALSLVGAVLVYLLMLPWLGFALDTWLLATYLLWLLHARWWVAIGMSLIFVISILLIFTGLFQVPLPTGAWAPELW
jgi:hypothetical protein